MGTLSLILVYLIFITLFRAGMIAIGGEGLTQLIDFLFGPYIEFWAVHGAALSIPLNNPLVLLIGLVFALPLILRMGAILRHVGAFVIALTLFHLIGSALGVPTVNPPSIGQLATALGTLIGLFLLGAISGRSRRSRLLDSVRQRIS